MPRRKRKRDMKNSNTPAAIALAVGMVISSCIMYLALGSLGQDIGRAARSLGQDIGRAASYAKPDPVLVSVPDRFYLHPASPLTVRLANTPGGSSLKIETPDKNK